MFVCLKTMAWTKESDENACDSIIHYNNDRKLNEFYDNKKHCRK